MISKNKNLFLKIYIPFVIIISIALIILTKEDIENYKLEEQVLANNSSKWPNRDISFWMYQYGYTKKLIKIRTVD